MRPFTMLCCRGPLTVLAGFTLASLIFGVPARAQAPQDEDHGRPVALVARELGVTPEQFRAAFRKVRPAGAGQQPTEAQRQANRKVLSESLGVSPERLDQVMDKYRPGGAVMPRPARSEGDRGIRPSRPPAKCGRRPNP